MTPPERDPADVDRVFAEMTARWTVGEAEPDPGEKGPDAQARDPGPPRPGTAWARDHPLFRNRDEPEQPGRTAPDESLFRYEEPPQPEPRTEVDDGWFERPEVTPIPWGSLSPTALLGGLLMTFTVGVLLLSVLGVRFPTVIGYLAVGSFVIGFGLLMTRLRGTDETDPGHGAQL